MEANADCKVCGGTGSVSPQKVGLKGGGPFDEVMCPRCYLGLDVVKELAPGITSDPAVCSGKPCLAGTRILVSVLVDAMADLAERDFDINAAFPTVTGEQWVQALRFAAKRCE